MTDTLLALARDTARAAGAQLLDTFADVARLRTDTKSGPTDLVSEADRAAEALIRSRLAAERPDDAILGEEEDDKPGTSGLRWVVDPLDATVNYLFGIPQWAVSIACEDAAGTTLAGVVFDAVRDECWTATSDGPAALDGRPLPTPDPAQDLAVAMIATGFGYDANIRAEQAVAMARLVPQVRDIRRMGCAALDLAWTAAGRYDVYYEHGLNHWDRAAGELICRRVGLAIRPLPALPSTGEGIVVGAPGLVDQVAEIVAGGA
jgi:myo-inositol-1(or 4)-monophosphatase